MSLSRCIFKMVSGEGLQWRILSTGGWLSVWNTTIWRTEKFWSPNNWVATRVKLPQITVSLLVKLTYKYVLTDRRILLLTRWLHQFQILNIQEILDQLVQIFFMFCSDWLQISWKVGICDWKFVQSCGEQLNHSFHFFEPYLLQKASFPTWILGM